MALALLQENSAASHQKQYGGAMCIEIEGHNMRMNR